jgi:hypothetical protein
METNEQLPPFSVFKFLLYVLINWFLSCLTYYYFLGTGQMSGDPKEPIGVRYLHILLSLVFFRIYAYLYKSSIKLNTDFFKWKLRKVSLKVYVFIKLTGFLLIVIPLFLMTFYPIILAVTSIIGLFFLVIYENVVFAPLIHMPFDYQWENFEKIHFDTSFFYYFLFCLLVFFLSIPHWKNLFHKEIYKKNNIQ